MIGRLGAPSTRPIRYAVAESVVTARIRTGVANGVGRAGENDELVVAAL